MDLHLVAPSSTSRDPQQPWPQDPPSPDSGAGTSGGRSEPASHNSQQAVLRTSKRSRPRSGQACVRCKGRKQRCLPLNEEAEDGKPPCRRCQDDGVGHACAFAAKEEAAAKRTKRRHSNAGNDVVRPPEPSHHRVPSDSPNKTYTQVPNTSVSPQETESYGRTGFGVPSLPAPRATATPSFMPPHYDLGPDNRIHPPYGQNRHSLPSIPPVRHAATYPGPQSNISGSPPFFANIPNAASGAVSETPAASSCSSSPQSGPTVDSGTQQESAATKGLAYISLEAAAEPHYIGDVSGSLWASMITNGMQPSDHASQQLERKWPSGSRFDSAAITSSGAVLNGREELQTKLTPEVGAILLEAVYQHLQPRYPFLDWIELHDRWQRRDAILRAVAESTADRSTKTDAFFILMIMAVGGQLCVKLRLPDIDVPEKYFTKAITYMDTIVQLHNLANVQAIILLAMYSLRDSRGPSVWYLSGIAIRLCIGMGLHRSVTSSRSRRFSTYELEMRKRVFWTVYILDRMMTISLGRPPGIADDDIDAEIPDDLDCVDGSGRRGGTADTSMSSSVHYIKLKRIESLIQRTMYGARKRAVPSREVSGILKMIDEWEAGIPLSASSPTCWKLPCCSRDWFVTRAAETRLYLLRPLMVEDRPGGIQLQFLPEIARNAALNCEIQKRMYQQEQPMSSTALHSLFLTGLTLLHAVYLDATVLPRRQVYSAIRANSNTLYAYSQQFKAAEVLSALFEDLSNACLERLDASLQASAQQANGLEPSANVQGEISMDEWQKSLQATTSSINQATQGEFAGLLESLGLSEGTDTATDELNAFSQQMQTAPSFSADLNPFGLDSLLSMTGTSFDSRFAFQ